MKLIISKSKNSVSLYIGKTVYNNGVRSSKIVEKLGTEKELREKLGGADPYAWAREYAKRLTLEEKESSRKVFLGFSPLKQIPMEIQSTYNGGYLFLQKIYYQLKTDIICDEISKRHKFQYDLNSILSRLVYGRIIFPASKRATCELAGRFIEAPNFDEHQIYRALEVLCKEGDYIQSQLYKNSSKVFPRNTKVLFYDCTNFFFEIEEEDGLKQYGKSKENRPNPIVQMGLFVDGSGVPLAFSITKGNTNEQITLQPLEKKILSDFNLSRFIVCTDAGLSSTANRRFNDKGERGFITTQSIKKLKKHLKEWALEPTGWQVSEKESSSLKIDKSKTYDISALLSFSEKPESACKGLSEEEKKAYLDKQKALSRLIFYKERWINEDGLEQKILVSYSLKYSDYQRRIRSRQIERAEQLMRASPKKIKKSRQNDYKRFVIEKKCTEDGEIAERSVYELNDKLIQEEMKYDGFYAVCTNLESSASEIIDINKNRWETEESFRIMKSEFKSRPVFLSRDDRIEAHFITCFLALLVYRLLEKTLNKELGAGTGDDSIEKYTCPEILQALKDMNFYKTEHEGYIPIYRRTTLTDALHDKFGFRTDYEIINNKMMKNIKKFTTLHDIAHF